jgi:hypothetical protein
VPWREREREGEPPSVRGELPLRPTDWASEASSLCERVREGGTRRRGARTAMCCLASKTHTRWWQARPPSVKLTDLLPSGP